MTAGCHAALFDEIEALCLRIRRPGSGRPSDAADLDRSPDGRRLAFTGTIPDALAGVLPTRICLVDVASGRCEAIAQRSGSQRMPRFAPDGGCLAFLADHGDGSGAQVFLLDLADGTVTALPQIDGRAEYLTWSPNGRRLLLGVAPHDADVSGMEGGFRGVAADARPSWLPDIEDAQGAPAPRRLFVYEAADRSLAPIEGLDGNVWDACWCGDATVAAITTSGSSESDWYEARLVVAPLEGAPRPLFAPQAQLGVLAADRDGRRIALVEGLASDRGHVFGDVQIVDAVTSEVKTLEGLGFDAVHLEWTGPDRLLVAGHRGLETLVTEIDLASGACASLWSSKTASFREGAGTLCAMPGGRGFWMIADRFERSPEIAQVSNGADRTIVSLDLGYDAEAQAAIAGIEPLRWRARDGLAIEGWLIRPPGGSPAPLVVHLHGGPVSHVRPMWLGRRGGVPLLAMLRRGMAIFLPNPRGSAGRGQAFAEQVVGDFGGGDTGDILAGIDHLVARGSADPARLGVTGMSYGGYLSAWLVTQDMRFAAAVPVSPVTNLVTQHLLSNIPAFTRRFVGTDYAQDAIYRARSPVLHAARVRTPTLTIAGGRDHCTPAAEAIQFHRALSEQGTCSALAIYPQDGHGVRTAYPASIDCAARLVGWFDAHLGPAEQGVPR